MMGVYSEECFVVYKYIDRFDPLNSNEEDYWEFIDNVDIVALVFEEEHAKAIIECDKEDVYPSRYIKTSVGYYGEIYKCYNYSFEDCKTIEDFEERISWDRIHGSE